MADTKISGATAVVTPAGTDEFATNQAGASKKTTLAQIKTFVTTDPDFAAGSASAGTWPNLASGTLLTTAEAGAIERDATNFYLTSDAGNRGFVPIVHFIRAASAQTLTSQTAAQNIFDSPANGTITIETGTYYFELLVGFTGMSATSGNGQILFGGTGTFGGWCWLLSGIDNSTLSTLLDDDDALLITNASAASAVTASTGTGLRIHATGSFECSVAGTFIPQIALVTAAAATVIEGSFFRLERMGAAATASVGQWT